MATVTVGGMRFVWDRMTNGSRPKRIRRALILFALNEMSNGRDIPLRIGSSRL